MTPAPIAAQLKSIDRRYWSWPGERGGTAR
jgi:hypothetical protein